MNLKDAYNDLLVQAMMFDMDIDIETWSLTPKSDYKEDFWITKWKEKRDGSDNDASSPDQAYA